ncbi:hypothetical protein [Novosphingobium sediminicola]|uniref:Uncharacterized protein n=1 Tax=Novosphingobium sediminicola TaxID=563162 RepID=A0A7W6CI31_9SPHN|nr:hypothetical protein [Novosphingobium sediminicola]MBB3956956.1 hypothetical protein [Novosphingobium sediminicola]
MFCHNLKYAALKSALCFALVAAASHACAAPDNVQQMTAAQLFQVADEWSKSGQFAFAEKAYRLLAQNPEAELRLILDEKPDAAGVRLELARIEAMDGHPTRDLRAA